MSESILKRRKEIKLCQNIEYEIKVLKKLNYMRIRNDLLEKHLTSDAICSTNKKTAEYVVKFYKLVTKPHPLNEVKVNSYKKKIIEGLRKKCDSIKKKMAKDTVNNKLTAKLVLKKRGVTKTELVGKTEKPRKSKKTKKSEKPEIPRMTGMYGLSAMSSVSSKNSAINSALKAISDKKQTSAIKMPSASSNNKVPTGIPKKHKKQKVKKQIVKIDEMAMKSSAIKSKDKKDKKEKIKKINFSMSGGYHATESDAGFLHLGK